jgi:uncharacterized membrane protein (UPF0182 family)
LPRSPRNPRTPGGGFRIGNFRKARSIWSAVLAVFVVGGISARSLASFYVNILWHDVVGRTDVFWGVLTTQLSLAAVFVTIFSLAVLLNLWLADRLAPSDVPISLEQRALAGYRQLVAKRQWLVRVVISFVLGLLVGLPASSQWQDWLLFKNAQSFDIKDPLFDRDVSFYIFKLPFIQFLIGWSRNGDRALFEWCDSIANPRSTCNSTSKSASVGFVCGNCAFSCGQLLVRTL